MDSINKVKSISIWIFIIPFVAINTCLVLITSFHELFPNKQDVLAGFIFPYIDGGASISRTARVFPTYLIFKPAMFLTAYFLIRYWIYNKSIILFIYGEHKYIKKFVFFGIGSAICLTSTRVQPALWYVHACIDCPPRCVTTCHVRVSCIHRP